MTRLKVALDGRRAVRPMTGIGHYIIEIARRIPVYAPEMDIQLLVDRPFDEGALPDGCTQVVLGRFVGDFTPLARLYSPLWLNTLVPSYLRRGRVSLYHGTNSVVPLLLPCRAVCSVHDLSFVGLPSAYGPVYRSYMHAQVRVALARSDAVISGSDAARSDLTQALGIAREEVAVIHHGVGDEFRVGHDQDYLDRVRVRFSLPRRFVLHVGIVEVKKGIDTLLDASAGIIRDGLVDAVVVAGRDGLGAREIRDRARELGLDDRAMFLGFVPQELLPALYSLASVVVFSSRYEGFGLPVLEGMASGVPVIAADASSIPEVAGDAAVLFPPGDERRLAEALRSVLGDAGLRSDLVRRGLARVKQFSWAESAAKHVGVYRKVLGIG